MKLTEAIRRVDELKHNTYTSGEKIAWLSELDGMAKTTIFDTHFRNPGEPEIKFSGYSEESMSEESWKDPDLLIPAPWDKIYILWLQAQIDYYNGEYDRYANSATAFNAVLKDYENFYHRTHGMPSQAFSQGGEPV